MTTVPDWTGEAAAVCVWCGSPFGAGSERILGRAVCGRCGTATTDPVPDQTSLNAAYGDWYWPQAGQRFSLIGDALLRRSRASMAARIDEVAPPGAILDVGAGEGTLIDALKEHGRKASGLERESDHPEIKNQAINEVEGNFAGVVFWHSLEHLGNPREAVVDASRLLIPGGVLVIAVPNNASMQARAFGDDWLHLDLPRHLVHFTANSLTSGLEESGFKVGRTSGSRAGQVAIGWLDGLVGRLPGDLDLYQSLRRKSARRIKITPAKRAAAIAAGVILFPVALACAAVELASRRSGSVYVEAHRV
ncbi:MAG: class I SAM-dependent methyltransferase [Thermoleophilia bacterium]|nr:class I SAM-dependent methyltransferase [Thermoleophilia bacterium]